jgi:hypothetical protein
MSKRVHWQRWSNDEGDVWERPPGGDWRRAGSPDIACLDPTGHSSLYLLREQTHRLTAEQRAAETVPGSCPWCAGRLP